MKKNFMKLNFPIIFHDNGFAKGFILKRELDLRECKHILNNLVGISLNVVDDFPTKEDYDNYNVDLQSDVNEWLKGDTDDTTIMGKYAGDCSDDAIGIWNAFKIAQYLQRRKVI